MLISLFVLWSFYFNLSQAFNIECFNMTHRVISCIETSITGGD